MPEIILWNTKFYKINSTTNTEHISRLIYINFFSGKFRLPFCPYKSLAKASLISSV